MLSIIIQCEATGHFRETEISPDLVLLKSVGGKKGKEPKTKKNQTHYSSPE